MWLVRLVFQTSAFGALPAAVSLGSVSLGGIITLLIAAFAFIACATTPQIRRWSIPVIAPLSLFWLISVGWWVVTFDVTNIALVNYPIVWGGFLFIIVAVSRLQLATPHRLQTLETMLFRSSYLYIAVLGSVVLLGQEDAATPQVGVIFFAFHLSCVVIMGRLRSIPPMLLIVLLQIALSSRIVVGADLLILAGALLFPSGRARHQVRTVRYQRVTALVVLGISIGMLASSTIADKTGGGDKAIEVAGITINTQGRWYWWGEVIASGVQSPWIGHGSAIPDSMLTVERWAHPHNDYLRVFHQLGMFGLVFWVVFVVAATALAARGWRRDSGNEIRLLRHTTAFGLFGMSILMVTDNTIVYSYVLYPLGALVGTALSLAPEKRFQVVGYRRRW